MSADLDAQLKRIINDRPYYICKSGDDHKDLQSQIGSMFGQYSRREDRINEEYLLEALTKLIADREREARIDELSRVPRLVHHDTLGMMTPQTDYVDERLAELRSQKEVI